MSGFGCKAALAMRSVAGDGTIEGCVSAMAHIGADCGKELLDLDDALAGVDGFGWWNWVAADLGAERHPDSEGRAAFLA